MVHSLQLDQVAQRLTPGRQVQVALRLTLVFNACTGGTKAHSVTGGTMAHSVWAGAQVALRLTLVFNACTGGIKAHSVTPDQVARWLTLGGLGLDLVTRRPTTSGKFRSSVLASCFTEAAQTGAGSPTTEVETKINQKGHGPFVPRPACGSMCASSCIVLCSSSCVVLCFAGASPLVYLH